MLFGQVVFTFNNFPADTTNLQPNGNAVLGAGTGSNVLRLTATGSGQSGSAWYYRGTTDGPQPVSLVNGFTTSFQFQISGSTSPADGFAFVIQNGSFPQNTAPCPAQNGTGGIFALEAADINCGGDIGYTGLTHSLAIEFDDFQNNWDLDPNHVAIQSCGASANSSNHNTACLVARTVPTSPLKTVIADGNPHPVVIKYSPPGCGVELCSNPNNLQVYLDGALVLTATYDLANLGLDTPNTTITQSAFVGFVARTGVLDSNQDILNWSFSTTLPPAPATQGSTVTATFNSTPGNLVQEVIDLTSAHVTAEAGTQMQVSNQAIVPSVWQPTWVPGTPFATSSCWPHFGEGSNCKLYTDLCTNNASGVFAGVNCPTSNPPSIGVTDNFSGPKIDPNSLPPNTGFGLLEATDNWQGGPCVFTVPSQAVGEPCPMNVLTSLTGDPSPTSGKVPHFNSTFISVYGVPQPGTSIAVSPAPNADGWINNNSVATPSVSATFTTSTQPPPVPNTNNYTRPNVAQLTYLLTDTANPPNPKASGTLTPPGPPTPPVTTFTSAPVLFGSLPDGRYLLNYEGQDDHGTRELVFTLANNTYSTAGKVLPINIDTTKPAESVSVTSSNPYLNVPDTVTYSCTDALSGVVKCGTQSYSTPLNSTPVVASALNTSVPGPRSVTIQATDAAGNTSSTTVNYTVTYQFFGFVPELPFPQINKVRAGLTIPAGYLLLDGNFKAVSNLKSISVSGFASAGCNGANPVPVAISGSLLNFGYGAYVYLWKTPSSLAGQCVTFQANVGDGVIHKLNFQLTSELER